MKKSVVDQIFGDNRAPIEEVLKADFADLAKEIADHAAKMKAANKAPKTDEEQAELGKLIIDGRAIWKKADDLRQAEKRPILEAGRELDGWFKVELAPLEEAAKALQSTADEYARRKAAEERARAEREAEEARRKADAEREKAEAARTAASAGKAEARAEAFEAKAERLEEAAASSAADLTRSRVGGVTASAKGSWVARITDYQAAIQPLGTLGAFLKREAIEAALNSLAKIQKDAASWPGVAFSQETKATFRR